MPFPYFHLLNVILLSQLVLLAYGLGTMPGLKFYFSVPIMVFVTIVLLPPYGWCGLLGGCSPCGQ